MERVGMESGENGAAILVFSHLRYDFVYQRPQQVVSRLARKHRVLFVEEPLRTDGPPRLRTWQPEVNVQVLQPQTPLAAPGFHDDQVPMLRELLQSTLAGLERPVVWMYTPMALPLVADIDPRAVVYDCMDELSAFRFAPRQLQQRETALLKRADVVFTGGRSLFRAKSSRHPAVLCLPSAVDAAHFCPSPQWRDPWPHLGHPRLGYCGVIDERIDLALLDRLARDRAEWQVFMVGPVLKIDAATLPRRDNLHWLGQQAFDSLPRLFAHWDVCLMPFALNEATRYLSPTKTLEYMAAGKPIVSTRVRDVADCYPSIVQVADTATAFVRACEAALGETEPQRTVRRETMQALAADQSWDATVALMENAVFGPRRRATAAKYENVVVGAGPTGLAATLGLSQDTLLVERADRIGGQCRSIERDGYTFDNAGRVMCSRDPYVCALYERLLGANVHWQNAATWIFEDGELQAAPATDGTQIRFGYPLHGGLQALMDGFLPLLPGELRLNTEVVTVDAAARRVELASGEAIGYQNLIVTAPLPAVVRLLGDAAPAAVRESAAGLRWSSLRCVHLGVQRLGVTDKLWMEFPAGGQPDGVVFNRIISQTAASPTCSPPGAFGFTCEIPYAPDRPLSCTEEELIERVVADCRRIGLLRQDDRIALAFTTEVPLAHVAEDAQRERCVGRIRNWLATLDIHLAGPFAEWDSAPSNHAFLAGRRAAQRLMHRVTNAGKSMPASPSLPDASVHSYGALQYTLRSVPQRHG
jgi:protoporphyrinogen oxidase/glycosyltransferase involved in cell wall biosynthesis